jgi:hypothetical protein
MHWRHSQTSNRYVYVIYTSSRKTHNLLRDDLILYTITSDATLRVYLPVIDTPQRMELHATLDAYSLDWRSKTSQLIYSRIFWLDREVVSDSFISILKGIGEKQEDGRSRRIREILEEGWDLFLRVFADGSFVVQAVAVSP